MQVAHTLMSITKMIVENWDNGTPSDSTVVFAGQSHSSIGMTVLIKKFRPGQRSD